MRTSEASGAGAIGFRAGTEEKRGRLRAAAARPSSFDWRRRISPITLAVTVTALICATLFVAYDASRTLSELHRERALAEILLSLPAASQASGIFTPVSDTSLADNNGLLAESRTMAGLAGRGAAAFLLAGVMALVSLRRRRAGMPDMLQRDSYRTLAAAVPMGLACWTEAGELIVCNERYRARLDIGDRRLTYHQAVSRLIAGGYMKLLREDENNRVLELHREDGSVLLIDERPLADGGFMTLVSDVTEQKRADALLESIREDQRLLARRYHEEKLKAEAASRSKTNFLAHLSHDIRTPLNHIIGFAELMKHETYGALDPRYADYVQSIKISGEHLLASFATILELAELESGQKTLRQDPIALDDIIEAIARKYGGQIQRAGLALVLGVPSGAIVNGDRLGLLRMLGNIVENAIRFTPHGGRITLAAFAADDGVVIEISDTGIGMSEERLASLSQPFALGDATLSREGIGQGLGISIARAIADLSGGRLAIDSSAMLGTTVAISLPLAETIIDSAAA